MATVIGDICAPTGKYIKEGEEKTSWAKCGVALQTEKGIRLKIDVMPVGGDGQGIWLSVFEKREQGQGSAPKASSQATQEVGDGEPMPF